MSETEPYYITPEEIERDTGGALSLAWQAKARMKPGGWVRFIKQGKKILHVRDEYRAHMAARMRRHTRDAGAQAAA